MDLVETIATGGTPLAYVIRSGRLPPCTTFVTPPELQQQVGFIVYAAGGEIKRHRHRPVERRLVGTSEVLIVQRGRCEVDLYSEERELVATRELRQGDIIVLIAGGHGFRMLEETTLLEVKQGPYAGEDEKERF